MAILKPGYQNIINGIDKEEVLQLVCELIKIPSHGGIETREIEIALFLSDWLKGEQIRVDSQKVESERFNVIATISGKGGGKSLMLNAHMDTVPPGNMKDPYQPKIEDGKLYGRGSADMKGALGAMAYSLAMIKRTGFELEGDLVLAGVVGEESGSPGTRYIVDNGPWMDMAIVGEPTGLDIAIAHKGIEWIEIEVKGKSAHGSVPEEGINAVTKATQIVEIIEKDLKSKLSRRCDRLVGEPTLSVGVINGGTAPNIVPDRCIIQIDRRWIPGESVDSILEEFRGVVEVLKRKDPDLVATVKRMHKTRQLPHPPLNTSKDHLLVKTLREVSNSLGLSSKIIGVQYWTDAALMASEANIPSVVFGPGYITQAHKANEYINIDELINSVKVYTLAALTLCTKTGKELA